MNPTTCKKSKNFIEMHSNQGNKKDDNKYDEYVVRSGDTVESVAAMFQMTPSKLCCINKLSMRTLFINQKLKIPKSEAIEISDKSSERKPSCLEQTLNPPPEVGKNLSENHHLDFEQFPLHYKNNFLKVRSKYITDTEGIISGKLLLTPVGVTFIPGIKDILVQEYGTELYTVYVPNGKIACISMYSDSNVMAYKRSQRSECGQIITPNRSSKFYLEKEGEKQNNSTDTHNKSPVNDSSNETINNQLSNSVISGDLLSLSISMESPVDFNNMVKHNYLCIIASPRYRKTKAVYQKEDEYWFMVPVSSTASVLDYMLKNGQTLYDAGANVDPKCSWADDSMAASSKGNLARRSSFAKVEKVLDQNPSTKLGLIKEQSIDWEIINSDYFDILGCELELCSTEFETSEILDKEMTRKLLENLPNENFGAKWELIYATHKHGWSLKTLYRNVFGSTRNPCILLLKDLVSGTVIGAMCNTYIRMSRSYYGNGTTFLFRWNPGFEKFTWSRKNDFILFGDPNFFAIGLSNSKNAIRINSSIFDGVSQDCATFDSPPLTNTEFFQISSLEVWSFY